MCDLVKERQKIEAILTRATAMNQVRRLLDRNELIEHGLSALREHYVDACSEECMRERCRQFVEHLIAQRKAQMAALPKFPASGFNAAASNAMTDRVELDRGALAL